MISNSQRCCCIQYLGYNENFYIEVRNESNKYINFLLCYKIYGKKVTKASPAFAPGKVQRMLFPENAENLCLRIYDSSFSPPNRVCTKLPLAKTISYYKVITTPNEKLECINI